MEAVSLCDFSERITKLDHPAETTKFDFVSCSTGFAGNFLIVDLRLHGVKLNKTKDPVLGPRIVGPEIRRTRSGYSDLISCFSYSKMLSRMIYKADDRASSATRADRPSLQAHKKPVTNKGVGNRLSRKSVLSGREFS